MHASEVTREVMERANELYWESDRSVNQIADDLELSKGALYGIIDPQPSGLGCPLCGDEVAYSNRTAKEREMLDCPTCDWEGGPDETTRYDDPAYRSSSERTSVDLPSTPDDEDEAAVAGTGGGRSPERVPPPPTSPPLTTVAGGALLGAAVGLALVLWARRRKLGLLETDA